jgi:L-2-hydroxyglutarate oxidase LhgO
MQPGAFDFDVVVIGAGVVGLAIGRALTAKGREVTVVDRHPAIGMETSSRNSEVIHAGIYYPTDSLKAQFCVRGRAMLYDYAASRHIAHARCGKLIIANGDQAEAGLRKILSAANAAGVDDLHWLDKAAIATCEPEVTGSLALYSPSTGIIDSHGLMLAYLSEIEAGGGNFVANTRIAKIEPLPGGGFRIRIVDEEDAVTCHTLVNSAGLWSGRVASEIDGMNSAAIPEIRYARGVYFTLDGGKPPFTHLVYPLPDTASLGVHATLDLAGQVRFGPDVEWIDDPENYYVDPARATNFVEAIADYWPGIRGRTLIPAYAGIRPKLCGPGDPPADFRIDGPAETGIAGLCCLYGIESPGLTSSLAIGEYVADLLAD